MSQDTDASLDEIDDSEVTSPGEQRFANVTKFVGVLTFLLLVYGYYSNQHTTNSLGKEKNPEAIAHEKEMMEQERLWSAFLSPEQINAELFNEPEVRIAAAYQQIITEGLRRFDGGDREQKMLRQSVSLALFMKVVNDHVDKDHKTVIADTDRSIKSFLEVNDIGTLEAFMAYLANMGVFVTTEFKRYFDEELKKFFSLVLKPEEFNSMLLDLGKYMSLSSQE